MAILPPVVEVRGEEATIEAGFLAAKLGLSVDRLRAEMRRGIIYGVVERGVGEDAGRLRLTFRYRALVDRGGRSGRHPERGPGPGEVNAHTGRNCFVSPPRMSGDRPASARSARGSTKRAATIPRLSVRITGSARRRSSKTRTR